MISLCIFTSVMWTVSGKSRFEGGYTVYAQLLVGVSLSAPVCLGLFVLDKNHLMESLLDLCLYRFVASPFILVGLVFSRLAARFERAKRLTSYALLIEGLTLGIALRSFSARRTGKRGPIDILESFAGL